MIKAPDFILNADVQQQRLNVLVIGAGGTGSAVMSRLFQMHQLLTKLGGQGLDVTLYDDDVVTEPNIGRQGYYGHDKGLYKSDVLVERFNHFGGTDWQSVTSRFDSQTSLPFGGSVIMGCVDNVDARKTIHQVLNHAYGSSVWIDCGNDSHSGQVVMGLNADIAGKKTYLPTVYDLFKVQLDSTVEDPTDSCSHEDAIRKQDFGVNDALAVPATQMLWRLIRHGEVEYQGVLVDIVTGINTPIPANPDIWAMYGYAPTENSQEAA